MIYLDNAATTNFKPVGVKLNMLRALSKNYSANPGRSGHKLSINTAMKIFKTRELIAQEFNVKNSSNVVFTSSCTEALNLAILGTKKRGGHVITTIYEHNSVLRPLFWLQKEGIITLSIISPNKLSGKIELNTLKEALQHKTYMVAINHMSNVTGTVQDIKKIGNFCKENNLLFLVDAAQSGGHIDIDLQDSNINLLALAGHKGLYGPQGIGVLIFEGVKPTPLKFGGTGINSEEPLQPLISPEAYEAGTCATPLIFGFSKGIEFCKKNKIKINQNITKLTKLLLDNLSKLNKVTLYTKKDCLNGVVSFSVKDMYSSQIEAELSQKYKICVRSGLHCAPLVHKYFNTTNGGMVRVSIGFNTKAKDIHKLLQALKEITSDTKT